MTIPDALEMGCLAVKKAYETPELREIGSLADLTNAVNKKHAAPDKYTAATNGNVVGSLYPVG
jgi:hypothetical protein